MNKSDFRYTWDSNSGRLTNGEPGVLPLTVIVNSTMPQNYDWFLGKFSQPRLLAKAAKVYSNYFFCFFLICLIHEINIIVDIFIIYLVSEKAHDDWTVVPVLILKPTRFLLITFHQVLDQFASSLNLMRIVFFQFR